MRRLIGRTLSTTISRFVSKIVVFQSLDRPFIQVEARDRGSPSLASELQLHVRVLDVNDNAPRFDNSSYEISLSEHTPRGSQLLLLKASDADANSKLVYRIEHADRPLFSLITLAGGTSALVTLAKPFSAFDERLVLVVSATDEGGLHAAVNVTITVVDENQAPIFVDSPIAVRVEENSPLGFVVVTMRARDADRGDNARLSFAVDSEDFASVLSRHRASRL